MADDFGLCIAAHATDFLVAAADFEPTFGEPEAGDRIIADGVDKEDAEAGANKYLGKTVAAAGDDDTTVRVRLEQ